MKIKKYLIILLVIFTVLALSSQPSEIEAGTNLTIKLDKTVTFFSFTPDATGEFSIGLLNRNELPVYFILLNNELQPLISNAEIENKKEGLTFRCLGGTNYHIAVGLEKEEYLSNMARIVFTFDKILEYNEVVNYYISDK